MPKPIIKKTAARKPAIKSNQKIPKLHLDIIKNKKIIESAIERLKKEHAPAKSNYMYMLDIVSKSSGELKSAREILKSEKMSEERINEILNPLENKRKQFLYTFNEFVKHVINSSKNKSLQQLDYIKFAEAEIVAASYKRQKGELISTIAKFATKSK